jgi:OmpA-OmpF porin, OOP family
MYRLLATPAVALALGLAPVAVLAQSTTSTPGRSSAWLPYTSAGYVGANVGRSTFDTGCIPGLDCDAHDTAFKLYTGGMLSNFVGLELGYLNMGKANRGSSAYKAEGLNFSLVGNVPFGPVVAGFAKVGTTYGWTDTQANLPSAAGGTDHGWGLSYGAGISYDVTPRWQIVGEWQRNNFKFVTGRDKIAMWSVGARYRF